MYVHIHIVLTSAQKVDKVTPKGRGKTTGNIGTPLSSSIPREVWVEPIIFIGISLGASFSIFQLEVKGRISEYK